MVNPEIAAKAAAAVMASKQFWRAFGLKMWSVADAFQTLKGRSSCC